ncbi:phospholipase D family protein [Pseudomonas sp. KSR10]|uniref:Phospholipase n=1 Tax=Stutzerimonas stutzeri TaxID=316 RepID=A0A0D9AUA6_STUST|nr:MULTISPECIES: phospholipase D family protein [Pseudomonadaceae]KJH84610.1 phospholipase [Stutzerimonas stutzeri]MCG6539420.1 phospholipase D family protein [Pseudomonas sp. KSR10]
MRIHLVLVAMLLLAGCAGQIVPAPPSYALSSQDSELTRQVDSLAARQPVGHSGFRLLPTSAEAFAARVRMIRAAETSLDVQYYIVHDGLSTRALIDELLEAADRGVRVRLLLDDTASDGSDYQIATLAAHPNILIRVFNPLHLGRSNFITRSLGRLLHLSQQHRRMHNKLMLADSSLAIVGGRNLGDEYFDADKGLNFTDIDLLGAGPVARQLAISFDQYWNHPLSIPIQHFLRSPPRTEALDEARRQITRYLDAERQKDPRRYYHLMADLEGPASTQWLQDLIWAPGEAMWDHPDKINASGIPDEHLLLTARLRPSMEAVTREMTLISAYFVPTEDGVDYLSRQAESGVAIRILTNSLEATDVPLVHGGYAPYRRPLLEAGVRLFELRRQPDQEASYNLGGESESSLHSKAAVFDRQEVFLGSLNFDPRSILWNTEVGVLIKSRELASEVQRLTLEGTSPTVSYEVRLVEVDGRKRLAWIAEDNERRKVLLNEPGGTWRRINAWFSQLIGLERML